MEVFDLNKKIRVLIVDDEKQLTLSMAKVLRIREFEVFTAFDGFDAVDAVKREDEFDVVVLDIKMPGMDGIETLKKIKELAPDTAIIILTGHATLETGIQAIREGAYDYLMKPCNIEDLAAKIREANDAEAIKRNPVLWPRNLVKEIMCHDFKKLRPEDLLIKAVDKFDREAGETGAETLFVMDDKDRLQGFITKRDLINEAQKMQPEFSLRWMELSENPHWLSNKTVIEVMQTEIITARPDERLTEAAHRMITHNFRTMPVVKNETVIGIIRIQDIFQYIEHETE